MSVDGPPSVVDTACVDTKPYDSFGSPSPRPQLVDSLDAASGEANTTRWRKPHQRSTISRRPFVYPRRLGAGIQSERRIWTREASCAHHLSSTCIWPRLFDTIALWAARDEGRAEGRDITRALERERLCETETGGKRSNNKCRHGISRRSYGRGTPKGIENPSLAGPCRRRTRLFLQLDCKLERNTFEVIPKAIL